MSARKIVLIDGKTAADIDAELRKTPLSRPDGRKIGSASSGFLRRLPAITFSSKRFSKNTGWPTDLINSKADEMKNKSAELVFQKKRERRRQLAKLPFEKKIEIVVELQKTAAGIRKDPRHTPWPL
jgi:hypothetical protein